MEREEFVSNPTSLTFSIMSEVGTFAEEVKEFKNIVEAGVYACEWLKLDPKNRHDKKILDGWKLYKGTLGPAKGLIVGIDSKVDDKDTKAYCIIRLDFDPIKGLHFNATNPYDNSKKLAATSAIKGSQDSFLSQINAIQGLTAQQIWTRWKTGNWIAYPPN